MEPPSPAMGQFEPALHRILWELREYLPDVIVVGGWVPYLYQRYGSFPEWAGRISLTGEVDVVLTRGMPRNARRPLADILRESGFQPIAHTSGAAWQQDPSVGEKVEFLIPNIGTAAQEGMLEPVEGQPQVSAVALDDLRFLSRHTSVLTVPIAVSGTALTPVDIRVPLLGAYVVNKAITFTKRQSRIEQGVTVYNPKRAKDLLYLHDVFAGGRDVVNRISHDLELMHASDHAAGMMMERGAWQIRQALDDHSPPLVEGIAMLKERDGLSETVAEARFTGFLTDFVEILADAAA